MGRGAAKLGNTEAFKLDERAIRVRLVQALNLQSISTLRASRERMALDPPEKPATAGGK